MVLRQQFRQLDPVLLRQDINAAQQVLSDFAASGSHEATPAEPEVSVFLGSLAMAWRRGPADASQEGQRDLLLETARRSVRAPLAGRRGTAGDTESAVTRRCTGITAWRESARYDSFVAGRPQTSGGPATHYVLLVPAVPHRTVSSGHQGRWRRSCRQQTAPGCPRRLPPAPCE